ncbi:MAG: chain-length determining protein [Deltaproteobacteria bacterium]|nr:chain-length determining protein [Candidatus Anaeroferrophillacea bacterium]
MNPQQQPAAGIDIQDIRGIVRRQKNLFIITFVTIFFAAALVAFALPAIYRSQATILIEEQQIPEDFVRSTVTSYVEERLQVITQQILSRPRLLEIINQFNLYTEMRDRFTTEEIVAKMRQAISMETISTEVSDKRSSRPTEATIAFTVGYEGKSPATVQKVTSRLASLYLEANLQARREQATDITTFLERELDSLRRQIAEREEAISQFKRRHTQELPEYQAANLQALTRLQQQYDQIAMDVGARTERLITLRAQLATIDPQAPIVTDEGKPVRNPADQLKFLRLQLVSLQARLSDRHPDVRKLKSEIAELESQVGETTVDLQTARRQLEERRRTLADMKRRLDPQHPDVQALEQEVAALTAETGRLADEERNRPEPGPADNPAYIQLETQMRATESDIEALQGRKARLDAEIAAYQQRLDNMPLVEKEYNQLLRGYEADRIKYQELNNKLMEARVSQQMEEAQQAERFTIIDPPLEPEHPSKPNRLAIVLIGFVLAMGAGVGIGALRESLNTSVKTAAELQRLTALPVLTTIPLMDNPQEKRQRRTRILMAVAVLVILAAAAVWAVHTFVMPLDILWIKGQRRLQKLV